MNKKLKLREYQRIWDKKADHLFQVAVWLFENREDLYNMSIEFDYPDYAGMPKKLSKKLTGDIVDNIQFNWGDITTAEKFVDIRDMLL